MIRPPFALAALVFPILLSGNASAQAPAPGSGLNVLGGPGANAYDAHWAPMHGPGTLSWSGSGLYGFVTGTANFAGFGDSVRTCYGIDSTQGGRNASSLGGTTGGVTEVTWFRTSQAWAGANTFGGVNTGLISIQSGSDSSIGADVCFSPFFKHTSTGGVGSGGHKVGVAAVGGLFGGTTGAPWPIFWEMNFSWGSSPVTVLNKLGDDSADPGLALLGVPARGLGNPLLANIIFEVQGPLNGPTLGQGGEQYYLSSSIEWTNINSGGALNPTLGLRGSGGVTNGNANAGLDMFSAEAGVTNTVASTRWFGNDDLGTALGSLVPGLLTPLNQAGSNFRNGRIEFLQHLAFETPLFWGQHHFAVGIGTGDVDGDGNLDPFVGSGGPDWVVEVGPLSAVDLIEVDHRAGAEQNSNVLAKAGTQTVQLPNSTSPTTTNVYLPPNAGSATAAAGFAGFTATFATFACTFPAFNRAAFLWSTTPSAPMIQVPGSWDSLGPLGIEGASGVVNLTTNEGPQGTPMKFDAITFSFVSKGILTFGVGRNPSDDFFADGVVAPGANTGLFSSLFEGMFLPLTSGLSEMKPPGGGLQVQTPIVGGAGLTLYLSSSSTRVNFCSGLAFETQEVANALTVVLQ